MAVMTSASGILICTMVDAKESTYQTFGHASRL
ncbi:hypothetical protein F442_22006 [Phytophthora nicotianae P10297]|uniref:Uncharacterized protein n=2 Tax=Phytophthora nicotianae TaxID=4792 RepID=W2PFE1_PHYN3|nr:hypothetical protein PPTG_24433 [Phytophthora nicotianae INRA-310]ETM99345.1 hypothetical protein PPTG_24433 [Phytophthora nicotianae INRA-310]ETP28707.1 hypothetical protein F442_22006 [Phytophthora nicotianae P10297]